MINIALFGAGRIGYVHALAISRVPGITVTHIADAIPAVAQKLADAFGAKVATIDEALADSNVNAVIIASPTDTHADLMKRAAKAGKAIFCEKPIALDLAEAKDCVSVLQETGALCAMGFNRRYDPQFAKLKSQLDEGKLGKVEMITITSRDPGAPPLDYIKVSGGLFLDMTIHDFDMARWLLGEDPVEITVQGANLVDPAIGAAGDIDSANVLLKTASSKLCVITNSRRAAYGYDQRIEVLGENGMLQAQNETETKVVFSGKSGVVAEPPLHFFLERYAEAYRLELEDFARALNEGTKPRATYEDGLRALEIGLAAKQALKSGKTEQIAYS